LGVVLVWVISSGGFVQFGPVVDHAFLGFLLPVLVGLVVSPVPALCHCGYLVFSSLCRVDSARLQLRLREAPALELDTSAYTIRGGPPDTGVVLNLHGRAGTTDESFVLDECRCVADALCALPN